MLGDGTGGGEVLLPRDPREPARAAGYACWWHRFETRLSRRFGLAYSEANMLCAPPERALEFSRTALGRRLPRVTMADAAAPTAGDTGSSADA